MPLPDIGSREYDDACRESIDRVFDRQVAPAVEDGSLRHVSVFALARWPSLVHLGARLGDKLDVDIYQRHRSTESWAWPDDPAEHRFSVEVVAEGSPDSDTVLVLSMSAAVHTHEVPRTLENCRIYRITPMAIAPLTAMSSIRQRPSSLPSLPCATFWPTSNSTTRGLNASTSSEPHLSPYSSP